MASRFSTLLGTLILLGHAGCGKERTMRDTSESRLESVKDIISLQRTGNPGEYSALCSTGTRETITEWDLRNDNACPHVAVPPSSGIVSMQRREDGSFDVVCDTDVTKVRVVTAADIVAAKACPTTPRLRFVGLSAGSYSCALTSEGRIKCWGFNGNGQLGDGSKIDRLKPVDVRGLSNVTALAGGVYHPCALMSTGNVKCWGFNSNGQLGDGSLIRRLEPVDVKGLSSVTALAGGVYHTCALMSAGSVKCWGFNSHGQLGDGTMIDRLEPVDVKGLSGVTALAGGHRHTCALLSTGNVKCWGISYDGQLGNGSTMENRLEPVDVKGLSGVTALAGGYNHTCSLMSTGNVKCWGFNSHGQLGDGSMENRAKEPVDVKGLSGVTALAAGESRTCALISTGGVKCWGENNKGQLGDGSSMENRREPVDVKGLYGVTAIAGGNRHTCALMSTGGVKCWGENNNGQLGDGTRTQSSTPVDVSGIFN